MLYALNDPLASFVFIYCIIVWKCMLKCVLRVRIKIYIYGMKGVTNIYIVVFSKLHIVVSCGRSVPNRS